MTIATIGIDLAKNVIQVHAADQHGREVMKKPLKRGQVLPFFVRLEPCLIGMEACGSAHYWARKLSALGHTVKLMAPQFVKPYVKTNKNDAADAEAICEAVNAIDDAIRSGERRCLRARRPAECGAPLVDENGLMRYRASKFDCEVCT